MKIIRSILEMSEFSRRIYRSGKTIGFVPTMGALHAGHASLIEQSVKENDITVVSIFVNPVQFSPNEDFKKYPRDLKKDAAICRKYGVDVVFCPDTKQMYPPGYKTYVNVDDLSECLCGKTRPLHFRGVATIVTKLFNIVYPDTAYFGQKDAQQAAVVKRLAGDLNMPVEIKVKPTVREKDGLALSSRNRYLNKRHREDALVLSQALNLAKGLVKSGLLDTPKIISAMRRIIARKKTAKIDYICVVDADTLIPDKKIKENSLIALAVRIGKTRLIDNIVIKQS